MHHDSHSSLPPTFPSYKYNIVVDGNAAPSQRLAAMLHSQSALLRQETPSTEFFYDDLVPYKHYVPLSFHVSDVAQKVRWCKKHDAAAAQIASNALAYARDAFTADNLSCYWHRLFQKYAARQKFKPALNDAFRNHRIECVGSVEEDVRCVYVGVLRKV